MDSSCSSTRPDRICGASFVVDGRERLMALGAYPTTSLAVAMKRADEKRAQVEAGLDPVDEERKAEAAREAAERTYENAADALL